MPDKKTVIWSPDAQAELRASDRETALRILRAALRVPPAHRRLPCDLPSPRYQQH
jgi:hypothetical protein